MPAGSKDDVTPKDEGLRGLGLFDRSVSRRTLLRGAGAGAALLAGTPLLEACSSGLKGGSGSSGKTITIGFVTPLTGPLAGFGSSDQYVVDTIRKTSQFTKGFKVGGKTYDVNIVVADCQSSTDRASQVATQLITQNHADIVLVTSTPEVTNPVASVCEAQHVPCVSTVVPWESWYFGRGAKAGTTFTYTTMFFFGVPEFGECFIPMWNRVPNDKVVAGMFPNDADGNAFRAGWPPLVQPAGYTLVDGGAYTDGTRLHLDDHRVQVQELRLLHQRAAAARLQRVLEAGRAAGLQAKARDRGQGAAVPGRCAPRSAIWSTTSPPTLGGRRTTRGSPR